MTRVADESPTAASTSDGLESHPSKWIAFARRHGPQLKGLLSTAVFALAMLWLYREFEAVRPSDIEASFRSLPSWAIAVSLLLTVCNYLVLVGYDWLALKLLKQQLPVRKVALASLLAYAFTNSLGTLLGGAPVRVRMYSSWGLKAPDIARLVIYIGLSFWLGLCAVGGILFVLAPISVPTRLHLPFTDSRPLGCAVLLLVAVVLSACLYRKKPLSIAGATFPIPGPRILLGQLAIAAADLALAAGALYVLLPPDAGIAFLPFVGLFTLAIVAAMISNIPGGLGVLELVLVSMLPTSSHGIVASLLAFRIIYYIMPLLVAMMVIAACRVREQATTAARRLRWLNAVTPRLMTGAVFVAGFLLLVSGALPPAEGRLNFVRRALPLPVVEISHFLGSLIGGALLILARGLQRRINSAWTLTILMLAGGAVVSLLKGWDYEEAAILTLMLIAMLPCHAFFYRKGRLLAPSLGEGWVAAVVITLALVVWIILFAYRHVDYSNDLWWTFAWHGDAPRSLRALFAVAVILTLYLTAWLFTPGQKKPEAGDTDDLARVATIVANSETTHANLALLGDKRFIFSTDGNAAVMFGCEGDSWIAMGDPIGPAESADDAGWQFLEACDAAGTWPVFYQVDEQNLSRYVDMGLSLLKLGEEARVPLENFSLEGSARKGLRHAAKKAEAAGMSFAILPQAEVAREMQTLRHISDAWLSEKSTAEKGFSLGYFDEAYLAHFDFAVIRLQDQIVAFTNVWRGANREELSVDLMRYVPDAPHGVMEYLFTQLMLYGHREHYRWFNLGMAPMSGVEGHRLGPLWNRFSSMLYQHGGHFYNFQGLRKYKDKFDPVWTPKYLASQGGYVLPVILANVASLIAGGILKTLRK